MPDTAQATASLGGLLTSAAVGALFAGVGWIIAYVFAGWREDRTKRLQIEFDHAASQSREFYAPLVALTDQLDSMSEVQDAIREGKAGDEYHRVTGIIYGKFFLPLHEEINAILKTKMHLCEGENPPESFMMYFKHFIAEKAYWNLANSGEDVSKLEYPPYPSTFYWDVRDGQKIVTRRYEDVLRELREQRWSFWRMGNRKSPTS